MRKIQKPIFLFVLLLGAPCFSDHLFPETLPPFPRSTFDPSSYDSQLTAFEKICSSSVCQVWTSFARGKIWSKENPEKSCHVFSALATERTLPIYPIVLLKQSHICPPSKDLLDQIEKYVGDQKPKRWLAGDLLAAAVEVAATTAPERIPDLALQASKLAKSRNLKIQLLQTALSKATLGEERLKDVREELFRVSPKLQPVPTDWWLVGLDAMSSHDTAVAITAFKKVIRNPDTPGPVFRQALEYLRQNYKVAQQKPEALKTAIRLYNWDIQAMERVSKKPKAVSKGEVARHLLSSGVGLARTHWTGHRNRQALLVLKKTEDILKNKVAIGEIQYTRARIFEEESKTGLALKGMASAIQNTYDPTLKSQFLWAYAWLNYKLGKFHKAIELLSALSLTETDSGRQAQQLFWLAKAYQNVKKFEEATKLFYQILSDDPLGYYALLSYRELHLPIPKPRDMDQTKFSKIPRKETAAPSLGTSTQLLDWLIALGEFSYARQLVEEEMLFPDVNLENSQEIFINFARAHQYAGIFGRINKLPALEKEWLFSQFPQIVFPTPFQELVADSSQRSGLWPEYIFSIMRQESSFDPDSVSAANAYGLLQLLPSVARPLAKKYEVSFEKPDDLLDPQTNLLLGALHLRRTWDQFDGQFVLATAAYNASPEAVTNWVHSRFHGDILKFIEDIPYEETRIYVKLVLRNFVNYLRLNTTSASIEFPEWCLEGIQVSKN